VYNILLDMSVYSSSKKKKTSWMIGKKTGLSQIEGFTDNKGD